MILIAGALKDEISPFFDFLDGSKRLLWHGCMIFTGVFHGVEAVTAETGTGKVNTAIAIQHIIEKFPVERIFFTGTAGSLNPDFKRGDLVAAVDCIQHDLDCSFFGYSPGQVPGDNSETVEPDRNMVESCSSFSAKGYRLHSGRILTGDRFIAAPGEREELRRKFKGDIVDMESASAGYTGSINSIPWIVIKAVSDNADGKIFPGFGKFARRSAGRISEVIAHILNDLREDTQIGKTD